jgi:hypothetical protein
VAQKGRKELQQSAYRARTDAAFAGAAASTRAPAWRY